MSSKNEVDCVASRMAMFRFIHCTLVIAVRWKKKKQIKTSCTINAFSKYINLYACTNYEIPVELFLCLGTSKMYH